MHYSFGRKNGIKWNGINEIMIQNDCRNIRRRFQHFLFLGYVVMFYASVLTELYILMVEFIIEMDSLLVK